MKKIKVAVIGCGFIATQAHIPNLFLIPDAELVALCDRNENNLRKVAEEYTTLKLNLYTKVDKVCSRKDIDAFVICTPSSTHHEIALKAARAGKHVFVEKPISHTVKQAEEMVRAFAEAKLKLAVGYYLEWMPHHIYVKKNIRKGKLGKVLNITVHDEILRIKPEEGIIMDLAPHYIDLIRWYFEDIPIKSVFAVSRKYDQSEDHKEGMTEIKLFFGNDIIGNLELYWLPGFKNRDGCSKYLKIIGTEGKYTTGLTSANIEVFRARNFLNKLRGPFEFVPKYVALPQMPVQTTSFRKELEDFVSSILNDREPQIPGSIGLHVMKIIEACYKSISECTVVNLNESS